MNNFFTNSIDELILEVAPNDPHLADSVKWLDEQSKKKGISFYDMVYDVLIKHDANQKAKKWLRDRN